MRGRSNKNVVVMLCAAACCMAGGCTTLYNPATGRTESYLISTPQEISMGRDMDVEVGKKMKILDNPSMQARLDRIGKRIALLQNWTKKGRRFLPVIVKLLGA